MEYTIRCPYCFEQFDHKDVWFRTETFFKDENEILDFISKKGLGSFDSYEEMMPLSTSNDAFQLAETCKRFIVGESDKYRSFWNEYSGQTTECKEIGGRIEPWFRPVRRSDDENIFKETRKDSDGFLKEAVDVFGQVTQRRVCPHCHNPLPEYYGKYDVKYISVIGVKSAGKTVYISQLLKGISNYFASLGYVLEMDKKIVQSYLAANRIEVNHELPRGTGTDVFVQPMAFTMVYKDANNQLNRQTFVLYDIAGELFDYNASALDLLNKFEFVKNSDGIIMLIDPKQVGLTSSNSNNIEDITSAVSIINSLFCDGSKNQIEVPLAVCISKGDMAYSIALGEDGSTADVLPSTFIRRGYFNASDYNENIQKPLDKYFRQFGNLNLTLETLYKKFNYFIFSSIGHGNINEKNELKAVTITKRIEEPLFWLLHKLNFIGSDVPVNDPSCIKKAEPKPKGLIEKIKNFLK